MHAPRIEADPPDAIISFGKRFSSLDKIIEEHFYWRMTIEGASVDVLRVGHPADALIVFWSPVGRGNHDGFPAQCRTEIFKYFSEVHGPSFQREQLELGRQSLQLLLK